MYRLISSFLFCLPAEFSHYLALKGLKLLYRLGISGLLRARQTDLPLRCLGLEFPNPVGLAAGLDKNGDYIDALGALGFGFIEVGTVTPKPQPGNPKPRLFRLKRDKAIINRMGFNNKGLEHMVGRLKRRSYKGIVGVNIGKNLATPVEKAMDDYLLCLREVYAYSDYIVINLSSPNTPGLRQLQFGQHLEDLLAALQESRKALALSTGRQVPLLIKIAPDMSDEEIQVVAQAVRKHGLDGISATNTTIRREGLQEQKLAAEAGGLSGQPLTVASTHVVTELKKHLTPELPVIGIGGIHDAMSACVKVRAGADLLQIYTGFIYQGPALIEKALEGYRKARN